jgi:hypothetical protein
MHYIIGTRNERKTKIFRTKCNENEHFFNGWVWIENDKEPLSNKHGRKQSDDYTRPPRLEIERM